MVNKIELNNIKLRAFHGVLEQERTVGNLYSINLTITTDFSKAMLSDKLYDTVSYAEVAEIVKQEMLIPSQLLEHVGNRIIKHIQARWNTQIQGIDLNIKKITPPISMEIESCGIHIII